MEWHAITALAAAVALLAVTPGPGVVATVSQSLFRGVGSALWLVAGIVLGDVIFLCLAAMGLAALAQAMGGLFLVVRLAGAGLLIYMGVAMFCSANRPQEPCMRHSRSPRKLFTTGLLLTLGNPKVIMFYTAFLPTVLDMGSMGLRQCVLASVVITVVLGSVLAGYALLAARARCWLAGPASGAWFRRGAGAAMVGAGVSVAARVD
ncbi:MAG: LysE family translocator [Desulfovibrio sp.]|nr:MAG: LysE family translocator [Desulfovibrio sp.]